MFMYTDINNMMKRHNVKSVVFNDFDYDMLEVLPTYNDSDYSPHYLISEDYGPIAKINTNTDDIYWLDINKNAIAHYGFTKTIDLFVCKYLQETDFKIYDYTKEFNSIIELLFYYSDLIYANMDDNFNTYIEITTDTFITKQINIKITNEDIM